METVGGMLWHLQLIIDLDKCTVEIMFSVNLQWCIQYAKQPAHRKESK